MRHFRNLALPVALLPALAAPASNRSLPESGPSRSVAVIAHAEVPVQSLSFAELRRIFLGERQFWSDDLRVTLLVPAPASRERRTLLAGIYERTETQYRHYWIAKVFRTEATAAPKVVPAGEMTGELVRAIPGAIALVDGMRVPAGVKVLQIEGKQPGQAGYPLR